LLFFIHLSLTITTVLTHLNRRTLHGAKRAVDTAVAWIWFQNFAASRAIVKILAGIRRHAFTRFVSAVRTGNDRILYKIRRQRSSLSGATAVKHV
jgi:hypothetical protein